ncbi:hypothetical protein HUE56_09185 [Azospirillum oryzae]|uniref:Uncharacterized protein n=1 Tax=Azospirillum oryzae TaxID=286727 RepID=A0A6N1ARJ4_9PROT|nr:hypothetical protein [Azospirillum oryzae]KAA0584572.1 hypothetical protein FZ938_28945 [Azospirillum oryzae]QKS50722.1 hypothetical protein HUE56_09185 [Azospirillum oryzae]
MAIDATMIDSSAVQRPVPREKASPVISDGHNGGPVEIQGDMSFWDFLDIINPLQHIPIVSTIYREITGDTIQPSMRIMGDMLYGGVIGGMASIANAVVEQATGQDVGETVMTSLGFGGGDHPAASTAVADASGGPAASGSPAEPPAAPKQAQPAQQAPAGGLAAALAAAKPADLGAATAQPAAGQPIRLAASGSAATSAAKSADASPVLTAQLAAGAVPHPSKMPARDTPLASSALAKHSVPRYAAPVPGAVTANARTAGATAANGSQPQPAAGQPGGQPTEAAPAAAQTPVAPDMLSETMMRNLAKYEQSRKAAQGAASSTTRVSG